MFPMYNCAYFLNRTHFIHICVHVMHIALISLKPILCLCPCAILHIWILVGDGERLRACVISMNLSQLIPHQNSF